MNIQNYSYNSLLTSVDLYSSVNIPGIYSNGPTNNGVEAYLKIPFGTFFVDLVEVKVGNSILLTSQDNQNENGVYICIQTGGIYNFSILQRRPDLQSLEQIRAGQFFSVSDGEIGKGSIFSIVTPLPATLGINSLLFTSSSFTFKERQINATDLSSLANVEILPNFGVGIVAINGSNTTFNNVINDNDPLQSQILANAFIVNSAGINEGSLIGNGTWVNVQGTLGPNSLTIVNATAIGLLNGELNGGGVIGSLIEVTPILTPTNVSGLSPRAVFNDSGVSLRQVDNYRGAFDYLFTADDATNYYVTAGTGSGQAGDPTKCNAQHVLKVNINGNERFIALFETN